MCFHPLSWGWLGWIALVPMLCLVRTDARPRRIYASAWLGGSLFFGVALQWMRVADYRMYATWAMLAVYCALYFPLAIYLTRALERRTRLPLVVTFPAVWVALEYLRAFALTGFPWYYLAHSQHEFLTIVQVADIGGAFAVSFLVAGVNALLFDVLYQWPEVRAFLRLQQPRAGRRTFGDDWPELGGFFLAHWRRGILVEAFAVGVLFTAAYLYGGWRLQQSPPQPGPEIALLQGSVDIRIRNAAHEAQAHPKLQPKIDNERDRQLVLAIGGHYQTLCKLAESCNPRPDLFIWPETSYPLGWTEATRELPLSEVPEEWQFWEDKSREGLHAAFKPLGIPQLLGVNTRFLYRDKQQRLYNSALLLNGQGSALARYDKMHRVPFGEYVPLRDWLPFMNWFAPYDFDYSIREGETFTRFTLDKYRFGVLICFEDTDPFLAPHYVRSEDDGPPVDFLVNISNDGWFDGTSEHDEHLAVSRFRAVECRRALLRSVNMGISAVIDGDGRVLKADQANDKNAVAPVWAVHGVGGRVESLSHADWDKFRKVAGVLVASVPIDNRYSFYVHYGDWLAGMCWLLIGLATVGVWLYTRIRPGPQS
jgi:apolipoprotein N-acyltransferase